MLQIYRIFYKEKMFSKKKNKYLDLHPSGGSPKSQCNFSAWTL
jgi:hypothetical protein